MRLRWRARGRWRQQRPTDCNHIYLSSSQHCYRTACSLNYHYMEGEMNVFCHTTANNRILLGLLPGQAKGTHSADSISLQRQTTVCSKPQHSAEPRGPDEARCTVPNGSVRIDIGLHNPSTRTQDTYTPSCNVISRRWCMVSSPHVCVCS